MLALSPALSGSNDVPGVGCFYYLKCHTTSLQGIFAVKQAVMDCEGVGGSSRWDTCGVCKGDNSTCAGCDNLPNLIVDGVKLTKECSGHGQCRGLVCSCFEHECSSCLLCRVSMVRRDMSQTLHPRPAQQVVRHTLQIARLLRRLWPQVYL